MRSRGSGRAGFGLIELLVVLGIAMIAGLMMVSVQFIAVKSQTKINTLSWIYEARHGALQALSHKDAWTQILQKNPNLACVRDQTTCTGQGGPIVLYDHVGKPVPFLANPAVPDKGYSIRGEECSGFSQSGSDTCPYRFNVSWRPLCRDSECRYAQIEIVGEVQYRALSDQAPMDVKRYGFRIAKAEKGLPLSQTCVSSGGTYNAATGECSFLKKNTRCPAGLLLVGFNPDGSLMCENITGYVCPYLSVLSGVDADGNLTCSPGCDPSATGSIINTMGGN